jgi:HSP20 family protein
MFFEPALRATRFAPRAYDRSFERFVNDAFSATRRSLNVEQDDKSWTVTLDVPGFAREDLTIGIEGAIVRIESQFKAAYELPQDIDVAASEAKLEHGVLTLKLGKLVPISNVSQLTIN